MSIISAIRGMNDVLPERMVTWQKVERTISNIIQNYAYREIRLPVVESTALFKRSIGEVTDIVEKEMYTFEDRNGDSLTLRPEGTAGIVRACLQHGLLHQQQVQRLWYRGSMFRHERPQRGRYRQFYQIGVEAFSIPTPDVDAELIAMTARFWQQLGLAEHVSLQLNTLGTAEERNLHRAALVDYLQQHQTQLDDDSKRRLHSNPLRILDSKNPDMQELIHNAPVLMDFLQQESRQHLAMVQQLLDSSSIDFRLNPYLVRGLDYYTHTVFEWVTDALGAQGTVCAGGRYDRLVEQLGGKATPAVGFALGLERIVLLVEQLQHDDITAKSADIYAIFVGEAAQAQALVITEKFRDKLPKYRLLNHCGGGGFKSQFKKADKSGADLALIVGESEVASKTVGVKFLRQATEQQSVAWDDLPKFIDSWYGENK